MNALGSIRLPTPVQLLTAEQANEIDVRRRLTELRQSLDEWFPRELARTSIDDLRRRAGERIIGQISAWGPSKGNLVLLGDTGAGKTSAAAWVAKRLAVALARRSDGGLDDALRFRWVTARALGVARREAKLGASVELLERAKRAKLLVLDDVGQGDSRDDLFDVLDHRYTMSAPTIVTSGLRMRELEDRFGPEVRRRIMTCGGRDALVVEAWEARR